MIRESPRISAQRSWFYRLFGGGPGRIEFNDGILHLGDAISFETGVIDDIETRKNWFWTSLKIYCADGNSHAIGGLRCEDVEALLEAMLTQATGLAADRSDELLRLGERLDAFEGSNSYRRHSKCRVLESDIADAVTKFGALVRERLSDIAKAEFQRFEQLAAPERFEAARGALNSRFTISSAPDVIRASAHALPFRPTNDQAVAIATDEDVTLVLAGAGSGKTAVIVGKVAHLVRNLGVDPQAILVLAFNRKAAEEVRGRLRNGFTGVQVNTFHAFGSRVIALSGSKPTISKSAADDAQRIAVIDEILAELISDPSQSQRVTDFILERRAPYRSQFDFSCPGDYFDYVRRTELRALSGDLVKSFEELTIANFLTLNGVNFEYEARFKYPTATRSHRQYQPDFYLPDQDIYLEHFALDRDGNPPPGWKGYDSGVKWKRGIHAECDTSLIETYSWQRREGVLQKALRNQLVEAGIALEPINPLEVFERLRDFGLATWLAQLIATTLNHVKASNISNETLRSRAADSLDRDRADAFLDVFEQVRIRYEELLSDEEALDFHDLINHASRDIRNGRWKTAFQYVLVDEFQDISAGRMAILGALSGPGVAFFLVGDDWQSIYRFAGSDISLMRNCGRHLGHVKECALGQTFRFGAGILGPSTAFILRNPAQTQRRLKPAQNAQDRGVTIVASKDPQTGLTEALSDIESRENSRSEQISVLILGRYRNSRPSIRSIRRADRMLIDFSTVHAAKGLEADYVVICDLRDARLGFPSQIEDDQLLHLVLPPPDEGEFPHAEERRLFYVAITRARRGSYLVADSLRPSRFVTELMRDSRKLRSIGKFRRQNKPACPRCQSGRLDAATRGDFMYCLNFPFCRYRVPRCQKCKQGFIVLRSGAAVCTNQSCRFSPPICESCGVGVMVTIEGRYGSFLGCTEFASDQPCRNKRNVRAGASTSGSL